ncbi:MAG TPA: hypothetical protein VD837_03990 [Terriglobales bacterium]|nr:hypothetical protein [Terriglobales bacterium]
MENNSYFSYFSEIEDHFCRRRGTILILSTLDWALIETWKDAGIPLEAVLRGIDAAFDKYDARPSKTRKVNSLAYCSQEVLAAAEDMKQAAEGATRAEPGETGFEAPSVAEYLGRNAAQLEQLVTAQEGLVPSEKCVDSEPRQRTAPSHALPKPAALVVSESAKGLRELASGLGNAPSARLEDLERRLTVMEEKIFGALLAATPDEQLVAVRAEADREMAPYRRKMSGPQIEQLHKQYVHKRLLERYGVPRLSLFYM